IVGIGPLQANQSVKQLRSAHRRLFLEFIGQGANGLFTGRMEIRSFAPALDGLPPSVQRIETKPNEIQDLGNLSRGGLAAELYQGGQISLLPVFFGAFGKVLCFLKHDRFSRVLVRLLVGWAFEALAGDL